jgi:outer membrane receptor for ferrienterochelin and colicins
MNSPFRLLLSLFVLPLALGVSGQWATVSGVVVDKNGPLPYVNVALVGTSLGATTSTDGRFKIVEIPPGAYNLEVRFVGHEAFRRSLTLAAGQVLDLGKITLREQLTELDEVVITGTMREVSRSASPVPVEVITPKLFQRNPSPALFDAVGMVNGVRPQINCSVCNTGDIHINGMEGPYTMVLIDGMPIVSGLSTVYGLSGIPIALVEQVEIVKGPGSALYGSEAMGGIINVITKDPVLAPLVSADVMGTSWQEFNADLGFRTGKKKLRGLTGISLFHYDDPRDNNGDGFTDLTLQQRISVFQKLAVKRPHRRVASLAARYVYEDRWGGQMNWTPAFAGSDSIYGESIDTRRWELIGQYQLPTAEKVMAQISWNRHQQDSWYGITPFDAVQEVFFGQLFWSHRYAMRHDVLAGLAYRYTFFNDNTPATTIGVEPFTKDQPQRKPLLGFFVQDEYAASDVHTLLMGYRLDNDLDHGLVHSPRFAWKYAPNGRFALRTNFGTGYRVVNLFTEDHAALTGSRTVVITEDLRPEQSWNGTVNVVRRWPGEKRFIALDGSLFYTRFSNRILPDYDTDPDYILYSNLDGHGISQGASLNLEARFGKACKVLAGATWMEVYTVEDGLRNEQYFAPPWSGTFTASYDFAHGTTIDLTGQWDGPMRLPTQPNDFRPDRSPWFALVNVQVKQRINPRLEFYGGVKNILDFVPRDPLMRPFDPFDRTADDPVSNPNGHTFDTAYMYAPLQGRRMFFGVRWVVG